MERCERGGLGSCQGLSKQGGCYSVAMETRQRQKWFMIEDDGWSTPEVKLKQRCLCLCVFKHGLWNTCKDDTSVLSSMCVSNSAYTHKHTHKTHFALSF